MFAFTTKLLAFQAVKEMSTLAEMPSLLVAALAEQETSNVLYVCGLARNDGTDTKQNSFVQLLFPD